MNVFQLPAILIFLTFFPFVAGAQGLGEMVVRSIPAGDPHSIRRVQPEQSKWRRPLPTQIVKLADQITFLAPLGDHTKILFSSDSQTFHIHDLKTGISKKVFEIPQEVSWIGAVGNTIIYRIGFGESYTLRTLPDLKEQGPWTVPGGGKADTFFFGSESEDFICLTTGGMVHQVSLRTLKDISEPILIDDLPYNRSLRPSSLAITRSVSVGSASPDLEQVLMGAVIFQRKKPDRDKLTYTFPERSPRQSSKLSGAGGWVSPTFFPNRGLSCPPATSLVLGSSLHHEKILRFFDAAQNTFLFSLQLDTPTLPKAVELVTRFVFCPSLDKVVWVDPQGGEIAVVTVEVGKLSRIYPRQISRADVELSTPSRFSYRPSFSRAEYLLKYHPLPSHSNFEIDPQTGLISVKEKFRETEFRSKFVVFTADLRGGDIVSGMVKVVPEKKD